MDGTPPYTGDPDAGRFPLTRHSAIVTLREGQGADLERAWEVFAKMYWKPVYKHLRIKWHKSNEDAEDLTQGFFASAIEKKYFNNYDPERARFRTYLRTCLDGYAANADKSAKTLKRGGTLQFVSYDFHQAELELQQSSPPPDEVFEKEWMRSLFSTALESFRQTCEEQKKMIQYRIFEKYDIEREAENKISYSELAAEFGITATTVTNYLAFARREFRKTVLAKLEEISATPEEYRSDARRLFGVNFP